MIQRIEPSFRKRHRHREGYAALVVSGKYEEVGDTGRWDVEPGDVICHQPFEAHSNRIATTCALVNIALPPSAGLPPAFRVRCFDDLLKFALQGSPEVAELLIPIEVIQPKVVNWCDRLAQDLQERPVQLSNWASKNGLCLETLSRRFKRSYGVLPSQYRIESQTRLALDLIVRKNCSLAEVALDTGFSDQAHMSRAVKSLTGSTPTVWRKVKSIQESSIGAA